MHESVRREPHGEPLHFGLGSSTVVDSIVIEWPSGIHQLLTDVGADQVLTVVETATVQLLTVYLPILVK